jgi:transposase
VVRRDPRLFGIEGTRWTLAAIHTYCAWLQTATPAGMSRLLARLEISWKRARMHVHSPDPNYHAKLAGVAKRVARVRAAPARFVFVYLDEFTFYRQPTLANAWEEQGHIQPGAERSHRSDTPTRVIGALNLLTGRVHYRRRSKIGIAEIVGFYQDLRKAYPDAEQIFAVQDNWPVHTHPDVLVALGKQEDPWPRHNPASWASEPSAAAQAKWGRLALPIQIVRLPTYASWTNPIEKLWRKLRAEVLHLHRLADKLDELRQKVDDFLDRFANGSLDLLQYVGLGVPD